LHNLIEQLRQDVHLPHWSLMSSQTAIQPILIGDNAAVMAASACLYQQGLWVPAIRPPTVPVGTARLRVTLSAAHSSDDVACLIDALQTMQAAHE
jgi:8-amino-7-oxononanoate synthase